MSHETVSFRAQASSETIPSRWLRLRLSRVFVTSGAAQRRTLLIFDLWHCPGPGGDDHSRVAYAEIRGDETATTAIDVLRKCS
ncbi:hypothetical protein C1I99_04120 [Micromonospora deserti]|uniref:Uncharacterized protein n=1 Tax=Micromonospora deserti TaxID=2070366 RepID=A0A2W2CRD9_9ACTN|nr:hypothetical protein C1I99_04120 [Micromonospora deserti]